MSTPAPASLHAGQFRVRIDDEIMIVTAGQTGTSWTVTRHAEGSTAATHAIGAPVTYRVTAAVFSDMRDAIVAEAADRATNDALHVSTLDPHSDRSYARSLRLSGEPAQYVGAGGQPPFLADWANAGGGTQPLLFYMDPGGIVHVEGTIKSPAGQAAGVAIFQLPDSLTSVLDNFNRADGALGANWIGPLWPGEPAPLIVSNQVAGTVAGWRSAFWDAAVYSDDVTVFATLANASAQVDLYAHATHEGEAIVSAYSLFWVPSDPGLRIVRVDSETSASVLEYITVTIANGDAIALRKTSDLLRAWRKPAAGAWGAVGAGATDTAYDFGHLGFELGPSSATRLDDFGGGQASHRPIGGTVRAGSAATGTGDAVQCQIDTSGNVSMAAAATAGAAYGIALAFRPV